MPNLGYVWWHPHHVDYSFSLIRPQVWPPLVHKRPPVYDPRLRQRYYVDDQNDYEDRILFRGPAPGTPVNRHEIQGAAGLCPPCGIAGFQGRTYEKDGSPGFVHDGPKRDELYWFERNTYQPKLEDPRLLYTKRMDIPRDLDATVPGCWFTTRVLRNGAEPDPGGEPFARFQRLKLVDDFKRKTYDGVGYL